MKYSVYIIHISLPYIHVVKRELFVVSANMYSVVIGSVHFVVTEPIKMYLLLFLTFYLQLYKNFQTAKCRIRGEKHDY